MTRIDSGDICKVTHMLHASASRSIHTKVHAVHTDFFQIDAGRVPLWRARPMASPRHRTASSRRRSATPPRWASGGSTWWAAAASPTRSAPPRGPRRQLALALAQLGVHLLGACGLLLRGARARVRGVLELLEVLHPRLRLLELLPVEGRPAFCEGARRLLHLHPEGARRRAPARCAGWRRHVEAEFVLEAAVAFASIFFGSCAFAFRSEDLFLPGLYPMPPIRCVIAMGAPRAGADQQRRRRRLVGGEATTRPLTAHHSADACAAEEARATGTRANDGRAGFCAPASPPTSGSGSSYDSYSSYR